MKMNKTKKIEETLAQIHPKFLLDHYWNILDLINWRGFVNSKDKECFTISDIREKITEEIKSPSNPFQLRLSLRSKEVIEKVVSELVNAGLLIKEEEKFKKTDTLSKFCNLLKEKFQANLRRYVTWGLWYLYNHRTTSFSSTELVSLLSYSYGDLYEEIPYLGKWKEGKWLVEEASKPERTPNFSKEFLKALREALGTKPTPEEIFYYIYAVLYSPTYRKRYAEFLKYDFPRVPLPHDYEKFKNLSELGKELVELHLLKHPSLSETEIGFPVSGSNTVEKVSYDEENRRVYFNKEQYSISRVFLKRYGCIKSVVIR